MRSRNFPVPILKSNGKLASYYWAHSDKNTKEWRPNFEVELDLRLVEVHPTRGSFRAIFEDIQGHKYSMMGSDFNELLKNIPQININGLFSAAHKSYDYTIRLVNHTKDEPLNETSMIRMIEQREGTGRY